MKKVAFENGLLNIKFNKKIVKVDKNQVVSVKAVSKLG